jgi:peptidoglycan-associated lipoprotein
MNTSSLRVVASVCILAVGCGSDPKPKTAADTHAATDSTSTGTATTESAHHDSTSAKGSTDTSSNVSIDDAIVKACGISEADAHFAFNSAQVEGNDSSPLSKVAQCFMTGPLKGRKLMLVGRADPRGETEYNVALGQSRADAVQRYVSGRGVAASQLSSTSRGALDASGSDESGWAKDRRVDLVLMR